MRLFVAMDLGEDIISRISSMIDGFKNIGCDVKWVRKENLHITLKFLGEVPERDVKMIEYHVKSAVKGVSPFRISLEGFGYFGYDKFIRVMWIGVKEGEQQIRSIMKELDTELNHVRKESYPHSVHLTVGRPINGNNNILIDKIKELKDVKLGEVDVKQIILKQSMLSKSGPEYSDVKTFELGSV